MLEICHTAHNWYISTKHNFFTSGSTISFSIKLQNITFHCETLTYNNFLVSWLIWRKAKNIFKKGVNTLNGRLFKMYECFCRHACHKKKRGRKFKNYIQDIDQWTKFSVVGSGDFRPISKLFSMNVTTSSPLSVFVSLYFLCKYTHKHTPR